MIYIVHAEGTDRYKIGTTNRPLERLRELQTACPVKLALVGTVEDEGGSQEEYFHKHFASRRVTGEWFVFSPSEIKEWVSGEQPARLETEEIESPTKISKQDLALPPGSTQRENYDRWVSELPKRYKVSQKVYSACRFLLSLLAQEKIWSEAFELATDYYKCNEDEQGQVEEHAAFALESDN